MDPFSRIGQRLQAESNNNLMMAAAEKARLMMMSGYPSRPPVPAPPPSLPPLPSDLLARYTAVQASLGLYSPALLAAAIRNSTTTSPSSLNSSLSSPRSPELSSPTNIHRYSPYIIPKQRHSPSPSSSPIDHNKTRTPSPGISPPPQFPSHSFPILR